MSDVEAVRTERLDLVSMSPGFLDSLLAGRRGEAMRLVGAPLPDPFPEPENFSAFGLFLGRVRANPAAQEWLLRAIVVRSPERRVIGHIGFHLPPEDGLVEIGFTISTPYRRMGYAEEAARALCAWAFGRGIARIRASVSPANAASLALVAKLGFEAAGTAWDEEDGEELVFLLATPSRPG